MTNLAKDASIVVWDDEQQGQIPNGWDNTTEWYPGDGLSEVTVVGRVTGGTTAITVEQNLRASENTFTTPGSADLVSADLTASLAAGATVKIVGKWWRVRIVQTVANSAAANIAVKASD